MIELDSIATFQRADGTIYLVHRGWKMLDWVRDVPRAKRIVLEGAELLSPDDENALRAENVPLERWWDVLRARRRLTQKAGKA